MVRDPLRVNSPSTSARQAYRCKISPIRALARNASTVASLRARADDGEHIGEQCEQEARAIVS
jgi:hypothetical protein